MIQSTKTTLLTVLFFLYDVLQCGHHTLDFLYQYAIRLEMKICVVILNAAVVMSLKNFTVFSFPPHCAPPLPRTSGRGFSRGFRMDECDQQATNNKQRIHTNINGISFSPNGHTPLLGIRLDFFVSLEMDVELHVTLPREGCCILRHPFFFFGVVVSPAFIETPSPCVSHTLVWSLLGSFSHRSFPHALPPPPEVGLPASKESSFLNIYPVYNSIHNNLLFW